MTIAVVQDIAGADFETYQRIMKELGDERPAGLVTHVAGATGEGMRIIDVWESDDAQQRFLGERLLPARERVLGDLGVEPIPPRVDVLDVQHQW
jgi:hypothetical protein